MSTPLLTSATLTTTGLFFIKGNGSPAFLDRDYRTVSPWNTVQATFGDGAGELPYQDLEIEYDDSFIYNVVRVTREGGLTQEATDATSRARYLDRVLEKSSVLVVSDTEALNIATALRDRYKEPAVRFSKLDLVGGRDSGVWAHMLGRELGDLITVKRRPPGGGAVLSKNVRVGAIRLEAAPGHKWRVTWSLVPEAS